MDKTTFDVIIVGGGIIGCSTAYYLMNAGEKLQVAVVERDPTYLQASTSLCVGGIRVQFSLKANIQISRYAIEVMERFEEEMSVENDSLKIQCHRGGILFLVDEDGRDSALRALALQKSLDCQVEWLLPEEIKQRYPLYEPAGIVGGTFGSRDIRVDPYSVLMGYKAKARSLGAKFIEDEVIEVVTSNGRATGVRLASGGNMTAKFVVNCAGAWSAQVAHTAGVNLPVVPVKHQVYVLETTIKAKEKLPAASILPSGLYILPEFGKQIVVGKSLVNDPVGFEFCCDSKIFREILWPELASFVPVFDRVKLVRGWAGLYEVNTLDENAILGEWPEIKGFLLANGFSGHGFQQAPAVGRYLSELILDRPPVLDLSIFRPNRILENKPLSEHAIV